MPLQISTLKFWINLEPSDYFHLIGTARGGQVIGRRSCERYLRYSSFLCLCGLREGVLPGVSLLSRRRLSGFPVDFAMGLDPGLIAILAFLKGKLFLWNL